MKTMFLAAVAAAALTAATVASAYACGPTPMHQKHRVGEDATAVLLYPKYDLRGHRRLDKRATAEITVVVYLTQGEHALRASSNIPRATAVYGGDGSARWVRFLLVDLERIRDTGSAKVVVDVTSRSGDVVRSIVHPVEIANFVLRC